MAIKIGIEDAFEDPDAKCLNDPDIEVDFFFPDIGDLRHSDERRLFHLEETRARYCWGSDPQHPGLCPVREKCLEFALRTKQREGVWGGYSSKALKSIRRQRAKNNAISA